MRPDQASSGDAAPSPTELRPCPVFLPSRLHRRPQPTACARPPGSTAALHSAPASSCSRPWPVRPGGGSVCVCSMPRATTWSARCLRALGPCRSQVTRGASAAEILGHARSASIDHVQYERDGGDGQHDCQPAVPGGGWPGRDHKRLVFWSCALRLTEQAHADALSLGGVRRTASRGSPRSCTARPARRARRPARPPPRRGRAAEPAARCPPTRRRPQTARDRAG